MKNVLQFLHRSHCLGEMFKTSFASRELMHFWSDLGKINIYPSWDDQMTCLMSQMITRHREISNELSWSQFGVEEDLLKLTETTLYILATSFFTFWLVLGDWAFDRKNELQIEKFKMFWKLYSIIFPTRYPAPNLDTGKASKSGLQKGATLLGEGATRRAVSFKIASDTKISQIFVAISSSTSNFPYSTWCLACTMIVLDISFTLSMKP